MLTVKVAEGDALYQKKVLKNRETARALRRLMKGKM